MNNSCGSTPLTHNQRQRLAHARRIIAKSGGHPVTPARFAGVFSAGNAGAIAERFNQLITTAYEVVEAFGPRESVGQGGGGDGLSE